MVRAFVLISVDIGSEEDVLEELETVEEVREAHTVYGVYDLIALIEAETMQELKDIIIKTDRAVPHRHDFDEMYLIIGDEKAITFEVMLGDETYHVSSPSAVYVPRGIPHAIRPSDATVGLAGGLIPVCLNGEYITLPVDK